MEKKIDLNAPAFAVNNDSSENTTAEVSQTESGNQNTGTPTLGGDTIVASNENEEQTVPYSRFSTVLARTKEAERVAMEAQFRLEQLERERELERSRSQENNFSREESTGEVYKGSLPGYWVKLFGDSDASREAYGYELQRQREIEERAEQRAAERALKAVEEKTSYEQQAISMNENIIESRIEDLSLALGRDLTAQEEGALLDIVDEYTPKDEFGNYAGDTIPFEKAWEIYELRTGRQAASMKQARSAATAVTAVQSEGESVGREKDQKDWDPRDWNSYRKRISN